MQFEIKKQYNPNLSNYTKEDMDIAYAFAAAIHKEFLQFIKAVVIFGSTARKEDTAKSDVDILVIVDDVTIRMTQEMVEAYRIITQRLITNTSQRLHVISLKFTSFWDYIRNADPVGINILRDGVAIIDKGFFDPLQALLRRGRIRPTEEAIWTYFVRAPRTLSNSRWHLMTATLDLYWAVVDAAHAALMRLGEVPSSPGHVADILHEKLVKAKKLEERYVSIMRNFYKLMKMILYREIKDIKGAEYEKYFAEADAFVARMKKLIEDEAPLSFMDSAEGKHAVQKKGRHASAP
ncbi:MAG TPA: hypothetical protein DCL42_08280 [Deltaproteobacteria bacterium]|nr:hypothetical protein [Deltaproteobacteria bacterium]HII69029.1 nucleotidyltransferase domain-containing protein [Candidatus Woesearchaeota archaeon]